MCRHTSEIMGGVVSCWLKFTVFFCVSSLSPSRLKVVFVCLCLLQWVLAVLSFTFFFWFSHWSCPPFSLCLSGSQLTGKYEWKHSPVLFAQTDPCTNTQPFPFPFFSFACLLLPASLSPFYYCELCLFCVTMFAHFLGQDWENATDVCVCVCVGCVVSPFCCLCCAVKAWRGETRFVYFCVGLHVWVCKCECTPLWCCVSGWVFANASELSPVSVCKYSPVFVCVAGACSGLEHWC